ncbi:uncharacterized protein KY384_007518 [Bacidia gigantensis]|uniref:uncharacterized protein n=1 Tax=Bacidia gigantensis TaxID=2732470 RepID=UPI001D0555C3|nr:uncharacterized protein KY384_007518 [Bacidia gigantensis]KAG8527366.1 hypothetical protein KY384_007518 [Bacidia gigantensis]
MVLTFLKLPPEIRMMIYDHLVVEKSRGLTPHCKGGLKDWDYSRNSIFNISRHERLPSHGRSMLASCRRVNQEIEDLVYNANAFYFYTPPVENEKLQMTFLDTLSLTVKQFQLIKNVCLVARPDRKAGLNCVVGLRDFGDFLSQHNCHLEHLLLSIPFTWGKDPGISDWAAELIEQGTVRTIGLRYCRGLTGDSILESRQEMFLRSWARKFEPDVKQIARIRNGRSCGIGERLYCDPCFNYYLLKLRNEPAADSIQELVPLPLRYVAKGEVRLWKESRSQRRWEIEQAAYEKERSSTMDMVV